jgi:hypothetical protein
MEITMNNNSHFQNKPKTDSQLNLKQSFEYYSTIAPMSFVETEQASSSITNDELIFSIDSSFTCPSLTSLENFTKQAAKAKH